MSQDRVILLDENTANRIAAGEVVERPASAVKELVENAIDAGATQIVVHLEDGGKERLSVSDNGSGMTRSDAILALQRHATSKIRSADDLFSIHTLGFRGEALPSIASVSHFVLSTKPQDAESGICIEVHGGDIERVEEAAVKDGTTVQVERLFYNTPARLKFLKSTPTEVARSVEVTGHLAAAHPQIAFRLYSGAQELFSTPGTGETLAALASVWGRDVARKLIPIHHSGLGLTVSGFIATPDINRPGRSHELFYVNRRPIKSRLLGHALEDAFRALTPDARYPIGAVFVEIDPGMVDVNVHPTKTEVKFTRDGEVHHAVSQAVKGALLAYGIVPTARISVPLNDLPRTGDDPARSASPSFDFQSESRTYPSTTGPSTTYPSTTYPSTTGPSTTGPSTAGPSATGSSGSDFQSLVASLDLPGTPDGSSSDLTQNSSASEWNSDPLTTLGQPLEPGDPELTVRPRPRPFAERLREFRVLGQARNTYIVALTPDGLAVIDQHVAHERVLYERLTVKRFADGIPVQRLATPVTINLGRREALLMAEHCASFALSGWEIEPFGRDSFALRAIPAVLTNKPYEQILRDMVDELVNQTISRRLLVQKDHVTITNACKMAVKAGDPLTIEEMTGLLEQLAETENPYLCPHGRPIVVTISFQELDKQFKRT